MTNSVLARRRLAQGLRRYRKRADRSLEDLAGALGCSVAKISRMETGISGIRIPDLRAAATYLDLCPTERSELEDLVRRARAREWWHEFSDVVPPQSAMLYGLEDGASLIRTHAVALVPGLLQTENYARALFSAATTVSSEVRERRLALRMRRRQLLDRDEPPSLYVLMDEALLHREIGGPEVMAEQWAHVLHRVEKGLTVRVIPRTAPAHRAEGVTFAVYDFAHQDLDTVAYVEALTHNVFVEEATDVGVYQDAFDSAERAALSPEETVTLLKERAAD